MKITLVILAVLGFAATTQSTNQQRDLQFDLQDIIALIPQFINDLINGLDVGRKYNKGQQRGVREFVDEVLALVDTQALLFALNDNLVNSPPFQEFFETISSQEAYEMVEEIRQIEEVQRIAQRLREMGIDVDMLINFIYDLLGWN